MRSAIWIAVAVLWALWSLLVGWLEPLLWLAWGVGSALMLGGGALVSFLVARVRRLRGMTPQSEAMR